MAGVDAGLSQRRISRLMGSSPSVTLRAIARHTGPDAVYLTEDARYGAQRVVLGSAPGIVASTATPTGVYRDPARQPGTGEGA